MPSPRLMNLLKGMVGLQELKLDVWKPRKEDIPILSRENLISLRRFECSLEETGDEEIENFCQMVPELVYSLELSFSEITGKGFKMLCEKLTSITSLDLTYTKHLTCEDLSSLEHCAATLTSIDIRNSRMDGYAALGSLHNLTKLRTVYVDWVPSSVDRADAVAKLKAAIPGIEVSNVDVFLK